MQIETVLYDESQPHDADPDVEESTMWGVACDFGPQSGVIQAVSERASERAFPCRPMRALCVRVVYCRVAGSGLCGVGST